MKIEKNFYDIMMQESDEIEAEIARENALLSEEESCVRGYTHVRTRALCAYTSERHTQA